MITGTCSKEENSGCAISNVSKEFTDNTNDDYSPGTIADRAGNATVCPTQKVKIDKTPPTCESTGGSENWVNSSSANKSTTLIGKCSDVGSGCVAGNEAGKTYDSNGNVNWLINWEGNWTELSPGTVYDAAGNATECPANRTVRHDWTLPTCTSSGGSDD